MDKREESSRIVELENQIRELRMANARLRASVEEYKNKEQTISSAIIASMKTIQCVQLLKNLILILLHYN